MKTLLLAALLSGVAFAIPRPANPAPACTAQVVRDYDLGFAYYAEPRLTSACSATTVLRIRKSSTLNIRAAGAPYQPIRPEKGAWELSRYGTTIPYNERWTSTSWAWQVYNEKSAAWTTMQVLP